MTTNAEERENRLIHETSPYLLQHSRNPVDWYAWGPEALSRAKAENKPIFLSIGYSACHWCHVMERESFENEKIAALLNEHFVCIKVDREERPDIDEIYMKYVVSTTGSGGWPMSVFLTPDLQPFFGGTYFPPEGRFGRPGFLELLKHIARSWSERQADIIRDSRRFSEALKRDSSAATSAEIDPQVLDRSMEQLKQSFDPVWGGFGSAPKFPHSLDIRIMLRHWLRTGDEQALRVATKTLDSMSAGGIYDHLGGGFARYSTDEKWLIPHFEKMLYDNALLIPALLEAFVCTRNQAYARTAAECCDWVLREMVTSEGGFASAIDADSEGEEGKFYVWTPLELVSVLGEERGRWAAEWFGVSDEGNFEHGTSALWRPVSAGSVASRLGVEQGELETAMEGARKELLEARSKRIPPFKDDKVLTAWNGLMISALAQAYQTLGEDRFLSAASTAARYVLTGMRQEDGRLFATARNGRSHLNAYLDDYAFLIQGLIDLYESDFDPGWIRAALELNDVLTQRFEDKNNGGYFSTGTGHEELIARLKSSHDGALPSGAAVQALNLLRLAELTGREGLASQAQRTLMSMGAIANQYPLAMSQLMLAIDFLASGPREIVIAGEKSNETVASMLAVIRGCFLPQRVVALCDSRADTELMPLLQEKSARPGSPRAYVCRNYTCKAPVESATALREQLGAR